MYYSDNQAPLDSLTETGIKQNSHSPLNDAEQAGLLTDKNCYVGSWLLTSLKVIY